MQINVGSIDRIPRIVIGRIPLSLLSWMDSSRRWLGLIGIMPLIHSLAPMHLSIGSMEKFVSQPLKPGPIFTVSLSLILAGFSMALGAQSVEAEKPMALRTIMEKLGRDMQAVTGAISKEDWPLVAELAPGIAKHAEPPMSEKVRILAWLGADAGRFRGLDGQVHDAATTMGEAAKRSDGQAVIAAFSKTQQSCLACHQSFRHSFVEHFYGER
ncbi:MAG: cytochrome c [Haliea sp.]